MVVAVVAAAVDIALKVLIDRQASISLLESKIELPPKLDLQGTEN
jgi:hypothetical protein